jgi:hypothetical protein
LPLGIRQAAVLKLKLARLPVLAEVPSLGQGACKRGRGRQRVRAWRDSRVLRAQANCRNAQPAQLAARLAFARYLEPALGASPRKGSFRANSGVTPCIVGDDVVDCRLSPLGGVGAHFLSCPFFERKTVSQSTRFSPVPRPRTRPPKRARATQPVRRSIISIPHTSVLLHLQACLASLPHLDVSHVTTLQPLTAVKAWTRTRCGCGAHGGMSHPGPAGHLRPQCQHPGCVHCSQ